MKTTYKGDSKMGLEYAIYRLTVTNEFEGEDGRVEYFYSTKDKAIKALENKVGKEELAEKGKVYTDGESVMSYGTDSSEEGYTFYHVERIRVL